MYVYVLLEIECAIIMYVCSFIRPDIPSIIGMP